MNVYYAQTTRRSARGIQSKALYQFTLQGADLKALYQAARDFESNMRTLPGLVDVTSDLQIRNPQVNMVIDRDHASALASQPAR